MSEHNCRICGLFQEEQPWGKDGESPTYNICPCCGVEFGNEDYTIKSVHEYRKLWLEKGAVWFSIKEKPINWLLEEQLKDISKEFV